MQHSVVVSHIFTQTETIMSIILSSILIFPIQIQSAFMLHIKIYSRAEIVKSTHSEISTAGAGLVLFKNTMIARHILNSINIM